MRAGLLRHRVTFQRQTGTTRDSFGAEIEVWTALRTQSCSIEPLRGREFFAAQEINAELTHLLTTRWFEDLRPKDRGLFGTRIFDFQSIINVEERNRELQIYARELV